MIPAGWIAAKEAGALSGLDPQTLRWKARKGEIKGEQDKNGRWHYDPESLPPAAAEPSDAMGSERDRLWRALERSLDDRSRDVREALDRIKDEQQNAAQLIVHMGQLIQKLPASS